MSMIRDFAEALPPVSPSDTGGDVYERFQREPNILALAVVDPEGKPVGLLERNSFTLKMAGNYGRALYAGRPVSLVMNPNPLVVPAQASAEGFFSQILRDNAASLLEGFVVVDDGRYIGVGTTLSLLRAGYAINCARADEMSRLAESLTVAEAEARAAVRAKSQFLAVMSHEVRTPLNGVLAVAEIMDNRLQQEELRLYVRTIMQSGKTLLRLLTDVLDLSRAEAGGLSLIDGPFSVVQLLQDVDLLWRPRAEQKGLRLHVELLEIEDGWVRGDAVRLKQVFNNLIGNALKFTDAGWVRVLVRLDRSAEATEVVATISDTGPGIPADQCAAVFEPFSRRSAVTPEGGAGLGLSICREIVSSMGGRLELTSEVGRGSTFRLAVALPNAEPVAAEAAPAAPEALAEARHILIVDDNETNRLVASTLVQSAGCTFVTACDGAEAVRIAESVRFDAILMDIKMPGMDGVEATRLIRLFPTAAARTPIVALTANADVRDADLYLAEGMDAVVQKPIRAQELLSVLSALLAQSAAEETLAA